MRRDKDRVLFNNSLLRVTRQASPETWLFCTFGVEPQVALTRAQVLALAAVLLSDAAETALRIEPA